ncbi:hypothetical protein Ciccas_007543, partial [Cichlidogyrus casuarinus]
QNYPAVTQRQNQPPWYHCDGRNQKPFLIGICGGSASGKTTVAKAIIESLNVPWVCIVSMDSYYKVLSQEERFLANNQNYDFDHPNAVDFDLLYNHLYRLKEGKSIEVPEYDFKTHSRTATKNTLYGADVIVFEGVLAFYSKKVLDLMDLRVFVDTDADERLARRLRRDIAERGRDIESVLFQYNRYVKPAYEQFIAPTMACAHIIVPRGGGNDVALNLIVRHIQKRLDEHSVSTRANFSKSLEPNGSKISLIQTDRMKYIQENPLLPDNIPMPDNLRFLPYKKQLHSLHTIIRNKKTPQDTFVFYADRLMRPLLEFASNFLPYEEVKVETRDGQLYRGLARKKGTQICGVSILRAGEAFEHAFSAVCKDARLGKILIQTNPQSLEPELHYIRLPSDIKNSYVFLFDATVATGAAAIMAIRILVEHDVPQDHIILVSLIMAAQGVYSVAYSYPQVRIVTTAVDADISDKFHILPGIGNFGNRYFGTEPHD